MMFTDAPLAILFSYSACCYWMFYATPTFHTLLI